MQSERPRPRPKMVVDEAFPGRKDQSPAAKQPAYEDSDTFLAEISMFGPWGTGPVPRPPTNSDKCRDVRIRRPHQHSLPQEQVPLLIRFLPQQIMAGDPKEGIEGGMQGI